MTALDDDDLAAVDAIVAPSDALLAARYPGDEGTRQPVHTVYVPADAVTPDLLQQWGSAAVEAVAADAPSPSDWADVLGREPREIAAVAESVDRKLRREPIEDLRVDFEDGYGGRPDDEEDAHAVAAAAVLAAAPVPFCGIRIKSMEAATRRRGLRTLDLVVGALTERGELPAGWVVTLPKVSAVAQVLGMAEACSRLEAAHGMAPGRLRFEVQVETPQAVLGADGAATVAQIVHAGAGRVTGLHFGTYDYSAALGISAGQQSLEHPAADHAKAVMQLAAAGTGVRLSDGSTNVLPVGSRAEVHAAWRLHARLVRRSLERGFYQGWDLHPAQLPTRYAATYLYFRDGLDAAADRLQRYVARLGGGVLDEPATARALASFVLRGLRCGAVTEAEVTDLTGLDPGALNALTRPSP